MLYTGNQKPATVFMAINLDPNRVRASSGGATANRRPQASDNEVPPTPARAHVNHIPTPESLFTLITGAVAALKRGIHWDRGTILNLLV